MIALLEPGPRTASVAAVEVTRLLVLDREGFVGAVTGHRPTDDLARERLASLHSADAERKRFGPEEGHRP